MTPICIRSWKDGKLQPSHGPYLAEMRKTAQKEKTELIDLYEESYRIVAEAGEEESKSYYMHTGPGEEPGYPEGKQDDTCFPSRSNAIITDYLALYLSRAACLRLMQV